MLAPSRVKKCVLPEKREMRWYHSSLFRELIVPELGDRYVAEYFWDSTPVPCSAPFRPPRLDQPPDHWRPEGFESDPFFLINPTSGWRQKSWLPDRWVQTLGALHEESGLKLRDDQRLGRLADPALPRNSGEVRFSGAQSCKFNESGEFSLALLAGPGRAYRGRSCVASRPSFWSEERYIVRSNESQELALSCNGNLAVQAPPSKDRVCRLRNLSAEAVIEAARQMLRSCDPPRRLNFLNLFTCLPGPPT